MEPATDKVCLSYLDLRWHLDPAAGSAASAGEHDVRLGRFDEESIREHLAAFRSLAKAVEDLEITDLQDEKSLKVSDDLPDHDSRLEKTLRSG